MTFKNGVPAVDGNGNPIQQFYRAVTGVDPTTGQPAQIFKIGMENDTTLQTTPSTTLPAANSTNAVPPAPTPGK